MRCLCFCEIRTIVVKDDNVSLCGKLLVGLHPDGIIKLLNINYLFCFKPMFKCTIPPFMLFLIAISCRSEVNVLNCCPAL